jgi:hypothetical protein
MGTKRTPEKEVAFLAALAETCSVSHACRAVGIVRTTAYDWRREDPVFAAAWERAKAVGVAALEDEAVRRAHEGVDEPVFYQGRASGTVRKYSDTLLIFLLKGHKPETYRERVSNEISGPLGSPVQIDVSQTATRVAGILATAEQRRVRSAEDGADLV